MIKMGRKKNDSETAPATIKTTTKIDVDLLKKARMVSIDRGIDLYDYIDSLLREHVERDFREFKRS